MPTLPCTQQVDSMNVPAIFVSPANSESLVATQSQLILLQSQEIAKEIIAKAIELHQHGIDLTDSFEGTFDPGLSASQSQFLFETKDIVQEVIERALELNQADALAECSMGDSDAIMAVFEAVDPEKGLSAMQSQMFFRAKEMVHDAVARSLVINRGIKTMNVCYNTQSTNATSDSEFRQNETDLMMGRVEEVVDKVMRKAIQLNLKSMEEKSVYKRHDGKAKMPPKATPRSISPAAKKGNLKKGMWYT